MRQQAKFLFGLVISWACVTLAVSVIVERTTRPWFANDLRLRAELVVNGARETLSSHWQRNDGQALQRTLSDISRDEGVMAAAACNTDMTLLTTTPNFPAKFSCREIGPHVLSVNGAPAGKWSPWHESASLPGGPVLISAVP